MTRARAPRHRASVASCLVVSVAAALPSCAASSAATRLRAGDTWTFSLASIDGNVVDLGNLQENVVLVDFWATWCPPCRKALPLYADLATRHAARGFKVLAIGLDPDAADVRAFAAALPPGLVVLHDPKGRVPRDIGVSAMPTCVLVDRAGRVRHVHEGFRDEDAAMIEALVVSLLDEAPPPGS